MYRWRYGCTCIKNEQRAPRSHESLPPRASVRARAVPTGIRVSEQIQMCPPTASPRPPQRGHPNKSNYHTSDDGSYGNDLSTPRACALRNERGNAWSSRASSFARSVLSFDGRTHTVRVRAAVKTVCACGRQNGTRISEQTRELQAPPQLEQRRQRLHIRAPGARWVHTRTLTRRLLHASPLDERCSVVDTHTVPNATRTPPRVPLRSRAEKSPHSPVSLEETACCS